MLIGIGGTIVVLLVVFLVILPQFIDYELVVDSFLSLELWQLGLLLLMAVVTYVLQGITLKSTLKDLGVIDSTLAMQASLAVKGSIPGPMDTAFRFRLALAYKYSVEEATLSAATLKGLDWLARLLMVPTAIAILLVSGQSIVGLELIAIIGLVVSIGGIIVVIGVLRSERLALRLGNLVQDVVTWLGAKIGRTLPDDLAQRVVGLRQMGATLADTKGLLGLGLQLLLQVGYATILTVAMAFVGVDFDILAVAFIWATVAIVYALPIGPGFIELAYMLFFGIAIGFDNPMLAPAMAAVMILRIFQWLLPMPIGYGLIVYWQKRDHFSLLSTDEAQLEPAGADGSESGGADA